MRVLDSVDFILLAALWGASFLFMRIAAPEFGPFALMFMRCTIGAAVLLPVCIWRGSAPALGKTWRPIALVGLINSAIPFALFGYAALQLPEPDCIGMRYPHQVSGGQLQRIMTAMAMSPRPDLIIFDEPTSALDPENIFQIKNEIELLKKSNITIIVITHDINFAKKVSDYIVFLNSLLTFFVQIQHSWILFDLLKVALELLINLWWCRLLHPPEQSDLNLLIKLADWLGSIALVAKPAHLVKAVCAPQSSCLLWLNLFELNAPLKKHTWPLNLKHLLYLN